MLVDDTLYTTLSRSIMSYATIVDLKTYEKFATNSSVLVSIVVSIPACHAGDQGSIPCRGDCFHMVNDFCFSLSKMQRLLQLYILLLLSAGEVQFRRYR